MTIVNPELRPYLIEHATPADEILQDLAAENRRAYPRDVRMQITPDQGAFLAFLVRLTGARTVVEVGTFTGYSAIWIARALPEGGRLITCDISEEWTAVARRYWERAEITDRIELRLGDAAQTLREMPREEHVDLAFVDADKVGYPVYYEEVLARLRPNGLMVLDNTLQRGQVVDASDTSPSTLAIREINDAIAADKRVESVLLSVYDGLTVVRKR